LSKTMTKKLIRNVNIIDGLKEEAKKGLDVLIVGKEIKKIQKNLEVSDCEEIDATGKYLTPGLIDAHVHLVWDGSGDPQAKIQGKHEDYITLVAAEQALKCVKKGLTTVRDVGGPGMAIISLRDAIDEGRLDGPKIVCSGPAIVMVGGHGWFLGREVSGKEEVRRAAREILKSGADLIKVMATGGVYTEGEEPGSPQLSVEEIKAAVEEAHNRGKRVASHAEGLKGIQNSIEAGVDSIEHCIYAGEEELKAMEKNGTYMVATLNVMQRMADIGVEGGLPEYAAQKAKEVVKVHSATFKKAVEMGVRIVTGTDLFSPYHPVEEYFTELEIMNKLGLSCFEVIKASTSEAAKLLQLEDRGVVREGKVADLLLLEANPLEDIRAFRKQIAVFKEGRRIA